jgi:hypothetical protein
MLAGYSFKGSPIPVEVFHSIKETPKREPPAINTWVPLLILDGIELKVCDRFNYAPTHDMPVSLGSW